MASARAEFEAALQDAGKFESYICQIGTVAQEKLKTIKKVISDAARDTLTEHTSVRIAGSLNHHTQVPGSDLDFFVHQTDAKPVITKKERKAFVAAVLAGLQDQGLQYFQASGEDVVQLKAKNTDPTAAPDIDIAFQNYNHRPREPPSGEVCKDPSKFLPARALKQALKVYNAPALGSSSLNALVSEVIDAQPAPPPLFEGFRLVLDRLMEDGTRTVDGMPVHTSIRNIATCIQNTIRRHKQLQSQPAAGKRTATLARVSGAAGGEVAAGIPRNVLHSASCSSISLSSSSATSRDTFCAAQHARSMRDSGAGGAQSACRKLVKYMLLCVAVLLVLPVLLSALSHVTQLSPQWREALSQLAPALDSILYIHSGRWKVLKSRLPHHAAYEHAIGGACAHHPGHQGTDLVPILITAVRTTLDPVMDSALVAAVRAVLNTTADELMENKLRLAFKSAVGVQLDAGLQAALESALQQPAAAP